MHNVDSNIEKNYRYSFLTGQAYLAQIEREVVGQYKIQRLSLIEELELAEQRKTLARGRGGGKTVKKPDIPLENPLVQKFEALALK